jgi:hypothetical protein
MLLGASPDAADARTRFVMAHLHVDCPPAPARVRVHAYVDVSGNSVLIAFPAQGPLEVARDPRLLELTGAAHSR